MGIFVGSAFVLGFIVFMVVSAIIAQRRLDTKIKKVYQDLSEKKEGEIGTLPFQFGALLAFAKPVDGGISYLFILSKPSIFLSSLPSLKNQSPSGLKKLELLVQGVSNLDMNPLIKNSLSGKDQRIEN